jgi:hypothetical protein
MPKAPMLSAARVLSLIPSVPNGGIEMNGSGIYDIAQTAPTAARVTTMERKFSKQSLLQLKR